jgi:ABC-type Fe3+-hydroxamate transport system substrate-binding protein
MSTTRVACIDQMGNEVILPSPPKRIISLVPSQTELLADLGLETEVVGITKFCIHPDRWNEKPHIGGTKHFDFQAISHLSPDLIIGNKEENYQEGITTLMKDYPVWMSDIETLADATAMIKSVGKLTRREDRANEIASQIEDNFQTSRRFRPARTLYLIWKKPWMAAGKDTFINSMLAKLGLINCIEISRYPEISEDQMKQIDPELIMLSSEPFPFAEVHRQELEKVCPNANVMLVDGEMFSWYGSRLLKAPAYFQTLSL